MKVGVFIKQVPDSETKIAINGAGSGIVTDGVKYVISPYDEFAVEEALRLKDKTECETVVVTAGPERASEALRTALAMGVDRAIHLKDDCFTTIDNLTVAKALTHVAKDEGFDIIFMGIQAIDMDNSSMAQSVATRLGVPHAHNISKFELSGDTVEVEFDVEGGTAVAQMTLPCVVGTGKGLNQPRYATLPGIMKAKKKEIKEVLVTDLGEALTVADAKVIVSQYELPPQKSKGRMIDGEPEAQARELIRLLHEEAKLI